MTRSTPAATHDLDALIEAVLKRATNRHSILHGPSHWRRVATFGERLSAATRGADPVIVRAFAVLHDSMRLNDDHDPQHGPRAAGLARELNDELFRLEPSQLETVVVACVQHTHGRVTDDPSIGVCWDADRLDLWRLAIAPDLALLSTAAACSPELVAWAREINEA